MLVIPVVVRTTDSMLNLVPNNLREADAALGCPQWRVITMVCYRAARSGILTGILLSVAPHFRRNRTIAVYCALKPIYSLDMNAPMANLPVVIYQYAASPFEDWNELAWAGAALIAIFVFIFKYFNQTLFQQT